MKAKFLLFSVLIVVSTNYMANAQNIEKTLKKEKFNINKIEEDKIGYAQAVRVGNTVYISGSVGWGKMDDALILAYNELEKTLQNFNLGFENVVKETLYTTAIDSVIKNKDIRRSYYGIDYPAATWVEVSRLYNSGLVVEVEVIAEITKNN